MNIGGAVIGILAGIVKLALAVAAWLHDLRIMREGERKREAEDAQRKISAIKKAKDAADSVRDAAARDPASIMRDDGFRRD
jgi:hypothetical protein